MANYKLYLVAMRRLNFEWMCFTDARLEREREKSQEFLARTCFA